MVFFMIGISLVSLVFLASGDKEGFLGHLDHIEAISTQNETLLNIVPFPASALWGNQNIFIPDPCLIPIFSNDSSFNANVSSILSEVFSKVVHPSTCSFSPSEIFPFPQQSSDPLNSQLSEPAFAQSHPIPDPSRLSPEFSLSILFRNGSEWYPKFNIDESYELLINSSGIVITVQNYVGFLRGISTFFQLLHNCSRFDETCSNPSGFEVQNAPITISDFPRFPHRGVMIDSSRHFVSLSVLRSIVSTMFLAKVNTLHWGLSNTDSFPFYAESHPELTEYGAATPESIYHPQEISDFIVFAASHGVRVIPEFDTPGHTLGWLYAPQWNDLNLEPMPNVPGQWENDSCIVGILDPVNQSTYDLLQDVYRDSSKLFVDEFFHMGGDEVPLSCYGMKADVVDFMEKNNLTEAEVANYFYEKRRKGFQEFNKTPMFWWYRDSWYLDFDENSILEFWDSPDVLPGLLENITTINKDKNYKVLLAPDNFYYLDTGFQNIFGNISWNNYTTWLSVYSFEPSDYYGGLISPENETELIIGGEVQLWSEFVNDFNAESRLFPRTFSMAEKMWTTSNQSKGFSQFQVASRLIKFNRLLIQTGTKSEAISNGLCEKSPNLCWV